MSKPATVHVTAAAGRLCPIAAIDATAPGGTLLVIKPGDVHELPNSSSVRRRIAAGDLVLTTPPASTSEASPSSSSFVESVNPAKEG
jgi:hypothetical protein